MRIEFCLGCGAPLEYAGGAVVECRYCGRDYRLASAPADPRPRLTAGGRAYQVEGLLGSGDACQVYRGRWSVRLGELVVIKVLRSLGDADLLQREWDQLGRLHASTAQGASHFVTRLPQPIAQGVIKEDGGERPLSVYGWQSGFLHTLEEVTGEFADGVSGNICVWMFKRLLELLGFSHATGVVHGAVIPPHVLVHPRDHGATLIGWSAATAWSPSKKEPLPAVSRDWRAFYPEEVARERWVSPAADLAMAARCVLRAAGARTFDEPGNLAGDLGKLVVAAARGEHDDAWALREQVDREASIVYGPPSYHPLRMPGWIALGR